MVDLFADVPEEVALNTLQTIRRNLDQVGLYGGHTLRRHTDIQLLALKSRLTKEDIRYSRHYRLLEQNRKKFRKTGRWKDR